MPSNADIMNFLQSMNEKINSTNEAITANTEATKISAEATKANKLGGSKAYCN